MKGLEAGTFTEQGSAVRRSLGHSSRIISCLDSSMELKELCWRASPRGLWTLLPKESAPRND